MLQGAAIAALVPILPKYATQVVKVSTVEYTVAIIIGGIGCAFYVILSKSSTIIAKGLCMELFLVALYYIQFLYSGYLQLQYIYSLGHRTFIANVRYPLTGLEYLYGWAY